MNTERWVPVLGHENTYMVSDHGRVRSVRSSKILKPFPDRYGYLRVELGRKTLNVHRLVLSSFTVQDKREVRHLNGVRGDNRLDNLAWGTRSENVIDTLHHGTNNWMKMSPGHAARAKDLIAAGIRSRHIADWLGTSVQVIEQIRGGRSWRHV